MSGITQQNSESALEATQGRDAAGGMTTPVLWRAEASIWTDRMKSALGNGVKVSRITLIDGVAVTLFDGLPASASRAL